MSDALHAWPKRSARNAQLYVKTNRENPEPELTPASKSKHWQFGINGTGNNIRARKM